MNEDNTNPALCAKYLYDIRKFYFGDNPTYNRSRNLEFYRMLKLISESMDDLENKKFATVLKEDNYLRLLEDFINMNIIPHRMTIKLKNGHLICKAIKNTL